MQILLSFAALMGAALDTQLINVESGRVIVEFMNGKIKFHESFLEEEMKKTGIYIPYDLAPEFDDKEIVYLDDPMFERAFIEVYYPLCIANSLYQWEN